MAALPGHQVSPTHMDPAQLRPGESVEARQKRLDDDRDKAYKKWQLEWLSQILDADTINERNHGDFVETVGPQPTPGPVTNIQTNHFHYPESDNQNPRDGREPDIARDLPLPPIDNQGRANDKHITFSNKVLKIFAVSVILICVYYILATATFSAQKEIEMVGTKASGTNSIASQPYGLFQYEQRLHTLEFSIQYQLWRYKTMKPRKPSRYSAPLENSLNRLNETKVKTHVLVQGLNTSMITSNRYIAHCLAAVRVSLHPCQGYRSWLPAWAKPGELLPDVKTECQNTVNMVKPLLAGYREKVDSLKDSTILVHAAMMGHKDSYPLSKQDELLFTNVTSELGILGTKLDTQIHCADIVSISLAGLDSTNLQALHSTPYLSQLRPNRFIPQHPYKELEEQLQAWKVEHDLCSKGWDTQVVKVQKKEWTWEPAVVRAKRSKGKKRCGGL